MRGQISGDPHEVHLHFRRRAVRLTAEIARIASEYSEDRLSFPLKTRMAEALQTIRDVLPPRVEELFKRAQTLDTRLTELESTLIYLYPPKYAHLKGSRPAEQRGQERHINRRVAMAEYLLGSTKVKSLPISADIDPSVACNFQCRICHHSMGKLHKRRFLSTSVIDKLDSLFRRLGEIHIFGGGEPTLSPTLDYLVESMDRLGLRGDLLTNGSTLGKRALPLSKLVEIGISFDGDNPRTFEAIRRGSRYKRLLARIRQFHRDFPHVSLYFNTVISRANFDELHGIVEVASALGVSRVCVHRMTELYAHHKDFGIRESDYPRVATSIAIARKRAEELNIDFLHSLGDLSTALSLEFVDRVEEKERIIKSLEESPSVYDAPPPSLEDVITAVCEASQTLLSITERSLDHDSSKELHDINSSLESTQRLEEHLKLLEEKLEQKRGEIIQLPTCAVPWFRASIRVDGTVRPCSMMADRMGCVETQGNFESVWFGEEYERLRELHVGTSEVSDDRFTACKSCSFPERYIWENQITTFAQQFGIIIKRR